MKRIAAILLLAAFLAPKAFASTPLTDDSISITAPSAILTEKETGKIIYEKNAYERLSPASVTKVMTLLLIMEELSSGTIALEDMVTTSARAASMGGSQIWLEEGETMSVSDMIKCITVVSANDCCVAMAEHISGTEEAFIAKMNKRAAELKLDNTHFTSCSGLVETDEHYSCAADIAVMSRELLKHELIKEYTTIWMDNIRNGEFNLSNTNKLIFYYPGATGLKTGFTSKAMYCLSASAMRDGVEYIAVILNAPTSQDRFESAKTLLSFGFANYTLVDIDSKEDYKVNVKLGKSETVKAVPSLGGKFLTEKSAVSNIRYNAIVRDSVSAPVKKDEPLGTLEVYSGDKLILTTELVAEQNIEKLTIWDIFTQTLQNIVV